MQGWKNTWDEWLGEERVLPLDEENLKKQAELVNQAQINKNGKRSDSSAVPQEKKKKRRDSVLAEKVIRNSKRIGRGISEKTNDSYSNSRCAKVEVGSRLGKCYKESKSILGKLISSWCQYQDLQLSLKFWMGFYKNTSNNCQIKEKEDLQVKISPMK